MSATKWLLGVAVLLALLCAAAQAARQDDAEEAEPGNSNSSATATTGFGDYKQYDQSGSFVEPAGEQRAHTRTWEVVVKHTSKAIGPSVHSWRGPAGV